MTEAVFSLWISLLKSGKYKNTYGQLADLSRCCGLGKRNQPQYSPLGLLLVAAGVRMSTINTNRSRLDEHERELIGISRAYESAVFDLTEMYELNEIAEMLEKGE